MELVSVLESKVSSAQTPLLQRVLHRQLFLRAAQSQQQPEIHGLAICLIPGRESTLPQIPRNCEAALPPMHGPLRALAMLHHGDDHRWIPHAQDSSPMPELSAFVPNQLCQQDAGLHVHAAPGAVLSKWKIGSSANFEASWSS